MGVPHVSARVVPQCARQCGIGASVGPGGIGSLRGIDPGSVRGTGPRVATIWVSVWVAGGLRTILASIRIELWASERRLSIYQWLGERKHDVQALCF